MAELDAMPGDTALGPLAAFNRAANGIAAGRVIPFLGAGISVGAKLAACDSLTPPDTKDLTGRLVERIAEQMEHPAVRERVLSLLEQKFREPCEKVQGDPKAFLRGMGLSQLSDLAALFMTPTEICEFLGVERFAQMAPKAAHRAIAAMVVEGWITEIITTNYDTCLEVAIYEAREGVRWPFASPESGAATPATNDARSRSCLVIRDLHEYISQGKQSGGRERPTRLYKINGCAGRWTEAWTELTDEELKDWRSNRRLEAESARIILTERDLQSFRDESWAEEMFRDRCRSHQLLFSGFGSEEPQVRHTALSLAREFERAPARDEKIEEVWCRPNAPVLQCFEPHLSFYQLQLMWGFMTAWVDQDALRSCPSSCRMSWVEGNSITGRSASLCRVVPDGNECQGGKLTADQFWESLFDAVWFKKFESEICLEASALFCYVRSRHRQSAVDAVRLLIRGLLNHAMDHRPRPHLKHAREYVRLYLARVWEESMGPGAGSVRHTSLVSEPIRLPLVFLLRRVVEVDYPGCSVRLVPPSEGAVTTHWTQGSSECRASSDTGEVMCQLQVEMPTDGLSAIWQQYSDDCTWRSEWSMVPRVDINAEGDCQAIQPFWHRTVSVGRIISQAVSSLRPAKAASAQDDPDPDELADVAFEAVRGAVDSLIRWPYNEEPQPSRYARDSRLEHPHWVRGRP